MGLSPEAKERLGTVIDVAISTYHWGFMPLVLYLGFRRGADPGNPPLGFLNLLWA